MTGLITTAPRGTRDILPAEAVRWRYVETEARRVASEFGFGELRTPLFEHTELFQRIGEATEIVQKEMYTFVDRGERSLTLRPEGTAPTIRAYLEHGLAARAQPVKVYYIWPMFRYERPQSGRYRQHHQFGAEVLGSAHPAVDAEIILLAWEFFSRLGLRGLELQINSIGCPRCRPGYRERLAAYFGGVTERLCRDCRDRYGRNVLRILDCKEEECRRLAAGAPRTVDWLCDDCAGHFEGLQAYLREAGLTWQVNPGLVRGLDYYNRTVFEIVCPQLGAQAALGGGGRYDGLAEECGGEPVPGIGFGLGLERLLLALEEQGCWLPGPEVLDVFVATTGPEAHRAGFRCLRLLRRAGLRADTDFLGRSLKAQMKHADRLGSRWVVIIGDEELDTGLYTVRRMAGGGQRRVTENELLSILLGETGLAAVAGEATGDAPSGLASPPGADRDDGQ